MAYNARTLASLLAAVPAHHLVVSEDISRQHDIVRRRVADKPLMNLARHASLQSLVTNLRVGSQNTTRNRIVVLKLLDSDDANSPLKRQGHRRAILVVGLVGWVAEPGSDTLEGVVDGGEVSGQERQLGVVERGEAVRSFNLGVLGGVVWVRPCGEERLVVCT